jgi:hypothetical protein
MTDVVVGGETFNATQFSGSNGQGHAQIMPALTTRPAEPLFPDRIMSRMLEDLAIIQAAYNLLGLTGSSVSSVTIGTGDKTFTTQSGKGWVTGLPIRVVDNAAPTTNYMIGTVKTYSSTTLVVTIPSGGNFGSGTLTDWSIMPSTGTVDGPTSATDYAAVAMNGASGRLIRQIASWIYDASDNLNASDKVLKRAVLQDTAEKKQDVTAAATTNIDLENGNVINLAHGTNITTLNITNWPASGNLGYITIVRIKDASSTARTIAWPAPWKWPGGIPPVLTTPASSIAVTDIITGITFDGGTTVYGLVGGAEFCVVYQE